METERSAELRRIVAAEQGFHNLLIDTLPTHLTVGGRAFAIDSNFRAGILFELMVTDATLTDSELTVNALNLFYTEEIPEDTEEAFEAIIWFYRNGYEEKPKRRRRGAKQEAPKELEPRVFSFEEDAPLIYAAFMSQYGIDLQDIEYLHWWKFNAMFRGIHEDERITEIIGYRSMDLKDIEDKKLRAHYMRLKERYALPDGMTVEQKIDMAGNVFSGGA